MKLVAAFSLLSLLLALPAGAASSQEPLDPTLEFETLYDGLVLATTLAFVGPDDILVLQKQDGQVLRIQSGALVGPVLDVAVKFNSEHGMLGIATDPDFINNSFVYLFYSESSSGVDSATDPGYNRLYRYRWNGSHLVEPQLILDLPQSIGPHIGGVIAFGPDDKLYVMLGDRAQGFVSPTVLQNDASGGAPDNSGVVLRLHRDGSAPTDNPFYNHADPDDPMNGVFAYGIRNSFGFDFDPVSGDLWHSENGPDQYDELNRTVPGTNSGHTPIWGPDARDPEGMADLWFAPGAVYADPQFSWLVPAAITTVEFIPSRKLGCSYEHDLLVGSYGCRVIYRFELNGTRDSVVLNGAGLQDRVADNGNDRCTEEQEELLFAFGPQFNSDSTTDIKAGPDGLLYLTSFSHGTLRRLAPVAGAWPDVDGDQVDDACDCDPTDPGAFQAPDELRWLRMSEATVTRLGWDALAGTHGVGTSYAVISGDLRDLRNDQAFTSACTLADGLSVAATTDTRPDPAANEAYYYLVRAGNGCGQGTVGQGAGSAVRAALDGTQPAACVSPFVGGPRH